MSNPYEESEEWLKGQLMPVLKEELRRASEREQINPLVVERLRAGNWQFGHAGRHHGNGTKECPSDLHHHHDEFCSEPTRAELEAAGINPHVFRPQSRR